MIDVYERIKSMSLHDIREVMDENPSLKVHAKRILDGEPPCGPTERFEFDLAKLLLYRFLEVA